jgi:hypothetical protein
MKYFIAAFFLTLLCGCKGESECAKKIHPTPWTISYRAELIKQCEAELNVGH